MKQKMQHSALRVFPCQSGFNEPFAVSVVIPTVIRASLREAISSIYSQTNVKSIQILIGVDIANGGNRILDEFFTNKPDHVSAMILQLPYSTSKRHGGIHTAYDGGSLRSILSLMAHSRYVAYLDDDNTWKENHLSSLLKAVEQKSWAYSKRMLVDEGSGEEIAIDTWDSTGPHSGRFADAGGFVDPNCLLIDKEDTAKYLGRWAVGRLGNEEVGFRRTPPDKYFFFALKDLPHGTVDEATVSYKVRDKNILRIFHNEGKVF